MHMKTHRHATGCMKMFVVALFKRDETGLPARIPSMNEGAISEWDDYAID